MEFFNLYRADNKGNKTMPEKYRTDGLLTKQINGGGPFFYKNYGWVKSIKSHIIYDYYIEKNLFETTAFLSFTDNEDIAKNKYLPTSNNYTCKKTSFELADAYLFSFKIDKNKLKSFGNGIFIFEFKCNYEKFKCHSSLTDFFIKCNICSSNIEYSHCLLLIDAVTYLKKMLLENSDLKTAYKNSVRDREWLLMPLDLMQSGIGYQSRIPVADFWNIEHYRYFK